MLIRYKGSDNLGLLVEFRPEGKESRGALTAITDILRATPKTSISTYWWERGILIARVPDPKCRIHPRDAVAAVKRILTSSGLKFRCDI